MDESFWTWFNTVGIWIGATLPAALIVATWIREQRRQKPELEMWLNRWSDQQLAVALRVVNRMDCTVTLRSIELHRPRHAAIGTSLAPAVAGERSLYEPSTLRVIEVDQDLMPAERISLGDRPHRLDQWTYNFGIVSKRPLRKSDSIEISVIMLRNTSRARHIRRTITRRITI